MSEIAPSSANPANPAEPDGQWTFFTNHTHVLVCIAANGDTPLREIANEVGITERAVQRIIRELSDSGVLMRSREGRRNHYTINPDHKLRHPLEQHASIGQILGVLAR